MPLLNEKGLQEEIWRELEDHEPIPLEGDVIVPQARLEEALAAPRTGRTGVALPNTIEAETLQPLFNRLSLITVEFPGFGDGRGFSIAKRLRGLGWRGELWADGRVIADQLAYLRACGFDSARIPEDLFARQPLEDWLAAAKTISAAYQTEERAPGVASILEQRKAARAARG
ncbi:DUF934 domain-containing protein [Neomegalonema sp.]|uniref:DUF934 domain-containing protein n=1 Tax=Neomegalonema sp. TaxID=2039713 RepID=UPI00262A3239|nr:DUF934 domain-containing protein [Neomegalonema sp.]MDD2869125.1 DUF934 domain-containing protein [Neomegalonema sp.]